MNKVLFYIDGDNAPGKRTTGIDLLPTSIVVKVFYASNNPYYNKAANRDDLINLFGNRNEKPALPEPRKGKPEESWGTRVKARWRRRVGAKSVFQIGTDEGR